MHFDLRIIELMGKNVKLRQRKKSKLMKVFLLPLKDK